jgi:hypothetical protein
VLKYALSATFAIVIAGSLSGPSLAMIPGGAVGMLGAAAADVTQPETVTWYNGHPAVSCNLRIPCPWYPRRGRHYARYRGHSPYGETRSTAQRDSYHPCPSSVEFPNGRRACLGLP